MRVIHYANRLHYSVMEAVRSNYNLDRNTDTDAVTKRSFDQQT